MAKKINVRFRLTREDIVKALRAYALRQRRHWIMLLISGGAGLLLLGRLVTSGAADEYTAYGFFAGAVFLVYAFWVLLINPWLEGRRLERGGLLTLERIWIAEPKELFIRVVSPQGKSADTRFEWRKIKSFYQTQAYYMLMDGSDKPSVHILPIRAFSSTKQRQGFVKMVTGELRKGKTTNK
ncbi:hypothetical protein ACFLZW_06040 [Chloroflexota bacterium]